MVQTPAKALTLDEFLQLPETKPASEFIDGQVIHVSNTFAIAPDWNN